MLRARQPGMYPIVIVVLPRRFEERVSPQFVRREREFFFEVRKDLEQPGRERLEQLERHQDLAAARGDLGIASPRGLAERRNGLLPQLLQLARGGVAVLDAV